MDAETSLSDLEHRNRVGNEWCPCGKPSTQHRRHVHMPESSEHIEETIASIPTRFRWATFKAEELRMRVRPASVVDGSLTAIENGRDVFVLVGQAGVGKTSLGCAMLRRLCKNLKRGGVFADAIDLAYARKQHRLGDGEAPEVKEAIMAGVLFLDEIGAEQGVDQTIEQIIRYRHNWCRPTIYGTPHTADSLRKRYGDGVARRMFEGAVVLNLAAVGTFGGKGAP